MGHGISQRTDEFDLVDWLKFHIKMCVLCFSGPVFPRRKLGQICPTWLQHAHAWSPQCPLLDLLHCLEVGFTAQPSAHSQPAHRLHYILVE